MNSIRKTHPMVLVAAAALTIFSILGSAAITGLITPVHSEVTEKMSMVNDGTQSNVKSSTSSANQNSFSNQDKTISHVACENCGTIVSIKPFKHDGEASGLGAVAGGVTGGVIGNQIGKGNGNTLMTILGVGGGAYAGHTIEKKINSNTAYLINIKMADGSYRKVTQYSEPAYSVGEKVKLISGQITTA